MVVPLVMPTSVMVGVTGLTAFAGRARSTRESRGRTRRDVFIKEGFWSELGEFSILSTYLASINSIYESFFWRKSFWRFIDRFPIGIGGTGFR
jgi:hypothetical protein